MPNLNPYRKAITAIVVGVLGWGGVVVASPASAITASEWLALGVMLATAAGVYAAPNGSAPDEGGQVSGRVVFAIIAGVLAVASLAGVTDVEPVKLLACAVIALVVAVLVP